MSIYPTIYFKQPGKVWVEDNYDFTLTQLCQDLTERQPERVTLSYLGMLGFQSILDMRQHQIISTENPHEYYISFLGINFYLLPDQKEEIIFQGCK